MLLAPAIGQAALSVKMIDSQTGIEPPAVPSWLSTAYFPARNYTFQVTPIGTAVYAQGLWSATNSFNDASACVPQNCNVSGQLNCSYGFDTGYPLKLSACLEGDLYLHLCVFDQSNVSIIGTNVYHIRTDNIPPNAPTVNTPVVAVTSVNLSWTDTDNILIAGYYIDRFPNASNPLATLQGAAVSYTDVTVSPNTAYTYRVKAFDAANNQTFTDVTVTTPGLAQAPTVTNQTPATYAYGPTGDNIVVRSDANGPCQWSSDQSAWSAMTSIAATLQYPAYSQYATVGNGPTALPAGSYMRYARCADSTGATWSTPLTIVFTVSAPSAPTVTNQTPATYAYGPTGDNIVVRSDASGPCQWSSDQSAWSAMTSIAATLQYPVYSQYATVGNGPTALPAGSYTRYARCADATGVSWATPLTIVFTVNPAAAGYDCELIAKFMAPAVQQIQAELPLSTMKLAAPQNANLSALLRGMTVQPVFPDLVKTIVTTGQTDSQLALAVNRRYSARASRHAGAPKFPELSRIYQIYQNVVSPLDCQNTLAALQSDPQVEYAQQDKPYSSNFTPNDPYWTSTGSWGQPFDDLWGLKKIHADQAWDVSQGKDVIVAVVDTGVDYNHPDLAGNIWINPATGKPGYDVAGTFGDLFGDDDPMDPVGHGTHIAGTISAKGNNQLGIIGLAPQSNIMAVKVFPDVGDSKTSFAAKGIWFAADNGAQVINMSFGSSGTDPVLADAIDYAYNQGAVLVAAAGNSSQDASGVYPAASPEVITVSAFDANDHFASFSNFGTKIDVGAPGVGILSLRAAGTDLYLGSYNYVPGTNIVGTNYYRADGTSMAAPHVTALCALILAAHPDYTNEQVRSVLRSSADDVDVPGVDPHAGYGRINAARAVLATGTVVAHILTPASGSIQTVDFPLTGTAQSGAAFSNYVLEVGYGSTPGSWTPISSGTREIDRAFLGTVPAGSFPDGTITVRLTVYGQSGQTAIDTVVYTLQRTALISPTLPFVPTAAQIFRGGSVVPFCASVGGAPNLVFEWAPGIAAATGWSTAGTSLGTNASCQVLGSWDTSAIQNAGYYTLRLSLNYVQTASALTTVVYVEPDLASDRWPQTLDSTNSFGPLPVADGQGRQTLLMSGTDKVGLASMGGSAVQEFSMAGQEIPAVGDVDPSPGDEIVKMDGSSVVILASNGRVLKRFSDPKLQSAQEISIANDYLGAGAPAILIKGGDASTAGLFAFKPDGTPVSSRFPLPVTQSVVNFLAVDIDGSGKKSLIVPTFDGISPFALTLYAADGSPKKWGGQKDQIALAADEIPVQIAAADVDGSGTMNIIIYDRTQGGDFRLTILNSDGSTKPGWPQTIRNSKSGAQGHLALGDLDHDGRTETIVTAGSTLAVFHPDGTAYSGWPRVDPLNGFGNLAIGDVNGDGTADILVTGMAASGNPFSNGSTIPYYYFVQTLFAFDKSGSLVKSWQLQGANGLGGGMGARPLIGDFDHSGFVQIALEDGLTASVQTPFSHLYILSPTNQTALTLLKLHTPFNAANVLWPSAYRDPQNSSVLPSAMAAPPASMCQKTSDCGSGSYCDSTGYCSATPSVSVSISAPLPDKAFTVGDTASFAGLSSNDDSALLLKIGLVIYMDGMLACSGQGYTCDTSRTGSIPGPHTFLSGELGSHSLSATAYIADKNGALISVGKNAGFAINVVPAPKQPVISSLPKFIPTDASLQVVDQGYSMKYTWSFMPVTGLANSFISGSRVSSVDSPSNVAHTLTTSNASLSLRSLSLPPGEYQLQVTATNLAGLTSEPATASVTLTAPDTPHVVVYPNPWRSDLHAGKPITFTSIPSGGEVKIFTVAGQWVDTQPESDGRVQWYRMNSRGEAVQSGLYIYVVTDPQGGKTRGKFVIIR